MVDLKQIVLWERPLHGTEKPWFDDDDDIGEDVH
jgi:hypothetical protein